MERAGSLIRKIDRTRKCSSPEQLALAAWPSAVGKKIAVHTRAVGIFDGKLVIEVGDPIWQRQLSTLTGQILRNLERMTGESVVTTIDYRVRRERMAPRREERRAGHFDEAEEISDPVFRLIYKTARKKATA
jgi:hypothetical protein